MHYPFIDIHTHKYDEGHILLRSHSLGEGYPTPEAPHTAGIHPWAVKRVDIEAALEVLRHANIMAVGEIGLDFAVNDADHNLQESVFDAQLKIALERNLPVIIHSVHAMDSTLRILAMHRPINVIFHSYIGSIEQTKQIIKLGYYISFSDMSLKSRKTTDSLCEIPLEKLFLETDAAEVNIGEIYSIAASKIGISENALKEQLYNNYKKIF